MAKINLLKREWVGKRQIRKLRLLAGVITFIAVGGFLLQTFYVAGRLVYLKTKIVKTKDEIEALNRVFDSNKDLVENYVWAQGVLEKTAEKKNAQYKYKDYLMEINSWLTPGTSLVGVSFANKDEIVFSVFARGIDEYREFETGLRLRQEDEGFGFELVKQESLSRLEDGAYGIKIRLKI